MQALESMQIAGFPINGIIHVGANDGQERYEYLASGAATVIYVEPIDAVFEKLKEHIEGMPGHFAVQAVCSDRGGELINFNVASNGGLSSSMLPLGPHSFFHPDIKYTEVQSMTTTTVDALISDLNLSTKPNLMVIDTQGADLKVLSGAKNFLPIIDGVYVEVSESPLYEGGCTFDEITQLLNTFSFKLRWLSINSAGHGDAFYAKDFNNVRLAPAHGGTNVALNKPANQSSTSIWSKANDAQGAVNGHVSAFYEFHTDCESNPWWEVDLEEIHPLQEIRIYNRIDVARERSSRLQVFISRDHNSWELIHSQGGEIFGGADGNPLCIILGGVEARYVKLELDDFNYLHLSEVEVY